MGPRMGSQFYLNNGRLDLSSLSEEPQVPKEEDLVMQISDHELIDLQEGNTATTLEEMALMFATEEAVLEDEGVPNGPLVEIEDEFTKAFSEEKLQEEMQEFGIKRCHSIDNKDRP